MNNTKLLSITENVVLEFYPKQVNILYLFGEDILNEAQSPSKKAPYEIINGAGIPAEDVLEWAKILVSIFEIYQAYLKFSKKEDFKFKEELKNELIKNGIDKEASAKISEKVSKDFADNEDR